MDAALNSKCADLFVNDWINNSHEILYEHVQSINDETNNVILRFKTIQAPIVKAAFKVYEHLKEHLKPQKILNLLNVDHEETYTYDAIIAAEYDVFRTVDFKMPLNTPITCVETLLAAANLESKIYRKTAAVLLDISFLQWEELYSQFQEKTQKHVESINLKKSTFLRLNILFLSAAVVTCTTFFHNNDATKHVVEILAEKSLSRKTNIMIMANILFQMAIEN
ncbi:uncharacterized protein LOC105181768 isoform X3 [Harpegnathos saltator]|uniref:uncharacterized protein LOC105181768 isoform X3 n=1 Tax=Harpegnathos saltator TaxID=610380 RepID=UPI000DBED13A|nr:uncharacterized protein LOC105181768 isoform X3 [Harpegnathos saltator]